MGRLTRAEIQRRNRAKVLAAAWDEFAERGFRDAKIDSIADRAELTRGAVYSNFPGKRALYFAVLAEAADGAPAAARPAPGTSAQNALGALARAWVARLPLTTDEQGSASRLGTDLMPVIVADDQVGRPFAQLMKLQALLLGLALEQSSSRSATSRMVRVAEAALTTLHGASQMAAAAPGFVEPFDVVTMCERLASLDLGDSWQPPHIAHIPQARPADESWTPPVAEDAVRGQPARLTGDGVVAVLGLHRIAAIEEAVRAAPSGVDVTAVLVTSSPAELMPLVRLVMAELRGWLRAAFAPAVWPRLQVVCDGSALAAAAGLPVVSDATEAAVRVQANRIVRRADGFGACHAAAVS